MTRGLRLAAALAAMVVAGGASAGCSSIDREIRSLEAEEQELATRVRALTDQRKSALALITALEQYRDHGGTARRRALDAARAEYERAAAAAD